MTIFQMPTIPDDVKTLWDKDGRKWERVGSYTWECESYGVSSQLIQDYGPLSTEPPGNVYKIEDMIPDSLVPGMILKDRCEVLWKVVTDKRLELRHGDTYANPSYPFAVVVDRYGPLTEVKE